LSDHGRVVAFVGYLKRVWQIPNHVQQQERILAYMMHMSERKLRKQLEKLRETVLNLKGFEEALDRWAKQEPSPLLQRWGTDHSSRSLKCCFDELQTLAKTQGFDEPELLQDIEVRINAYRQWFPHITALASTLFLEDVDFGRVELLPDLAYSLRRLRRRCLKLRWYEVGVSLLCTLGRDSIWRILGEEDYVSFLQEPDCESETAPLRLERLELPPLPAPMTRYYSTAQHAVQAILSSINSEESEENDEPYACDISHKPFVEIHWTSTCTPRYHPELQLIEHLQHCDLQITPFYIGGSHLICRACKWYIEGLADNTVAVRTGGLETKYLEVPGEWLLPASEAGRKCAERIGEDAAKLVLHEEDLQRAAWEAENQSELEMEVESSLKDSGMPQND
ncbi:hypothetical protein M422DRAFT_32247, partial [Sphaerobolus stellatus SS14]